MAVQTTPCGDPSITGRQAFARILNVRNAGLVAGFCLLYVLGRLLPMLYVDPLDTWLLNAARFLRQNLISGLILLTAVAAVDAAVVRWRLRRGHALGLALAVIPAVSALAMTLRVIVFGTPLAQLNVAYFLSVSALWAVFGVLAYAIFYLLRDEEAQRARLCDAECRSQALNAQRVEADLSALQAQIEPHFLFNTLATVKRLYETTPARGREMLGSLIHYLRAVLPAMREHGSTLGRELDLARSYLTILQMRMGERLAFSISAPADLLDTPMPPMILPTLVENAIKHGLAPLPEGGAIAIAARRDVDTLELSVRDNGAGFSGFGGSGVGLANTRSRLAALYGSDASLELSASSSRGVVAVVRLPLAEPAVAAAAAAGATP